MKKPMAILTMLLLALPGLAADWSFYGSIRQATFYEYQDFGDYDQQNVLNGLGETDDWGVQWRFQDNSRLGARVKSDRVGGLIELALNSTSTNGGNVVRGSDGGDGTVTTRRAYGTWRFADNATLKIGKDYGPLSNLVSGGAYDSDFALKGQGDMYDKRPSGITLVLGGFELALLTNAVTESNDLTPTGADIDWEIPRVESRYTLKFDNFQLIPMAGFQYFKVSEANSALTDDLDVYSYALGIVAKMDIGAFYITGEGVFGQNWGNANWANGRASTYRGIGGFSASSASLKNNDDINDADSWMALLLAGLKATDSLKFEAGFGYRVDDPNNPAFDEVKCWEGYLQAVVTLAPGVYIVPEIGYIDYGDLNNNDLGYKWYAGAKWQIDF
jgi:hypothetical protein